jgi:hypothetical protein
MRGFEQRDPRSGIAGLGDRAWPIGLAGLVAARGQTERRPHGFDLAKRAGSSIAAT